METAQAPLLSFMHDLAQFNVPIYQRQYSWTTKYCERLFADIINAGRSDSSEMHFFGSIVFVKPPSGMPMAVNQLTVIDGQQRLTTITLLLHALIQIISTRTDVHTVTVPGVLEYLFNVNTPNEVDKQKLILTRSDKETLNLLLEDSSIQPTNPAKNIRVNYEYFTKELKKIEDEIDNFWLGIKKLNIVMVGLDLELGDDPQLIFETINSTGMQLTKADLIRNFLLMGQQPDKQKQLYEDYWVPMEQIITKSTKKDAFDNFMKDFLTVKQLNIPEMEKIYEQFKEYYRDENKDNELCLKELRKFAELYKIIALEIHSNRDIKQSISNINKLKITAAYPFLLQVFSDLDEDKITDETVLQIMYTIESYRFRRQICELGTTGESRLFAELHSKINQENKQLYAESVNGILQSQTGKRRFPTDETFYTKLLTADMYPKRNADYPLLKLEDSLRLKKESLNALDKSDISVEHVLPQNPRLPDCWKKALGDDWQDIQPKIVNRLGNLTITKLNPEMSDNCFLEKKRIALDPTTYLLSDYFKDLTTWDENTITKRTEKLAESALEVWKYPNLTDEIVAKYRDDDDEEDDDEEDNLNTEAEWADNKKRATTKIIRLLDELTKEIVPKYSSVSTLVHQRGDTRLHFHTEEPQKPENLFLVMTVKKEVLKITFRIDHNNPDFANIYIKNKKVAKRKSANWFKETNYIPEHAERIMAIRSSEDLPLALEQIEHAYQTTSKRLNYKNT